MAATAALAATSPAAAAADTLSVDFGDSTGKVHGGAAGYLYGLGDPGVPTTAVVAGAGVRHVTQMPEGGLQHPNGGALTNSPDFFSSGGEEIYINIQDDYAQWPYAGNTYPGQVEYLTHVQTVVQKVADVTAPEDYDRYIFTPFNEPDWIWYADWSTRKDQFLSDWSAAYDLIQSIMPGVRVAAMGDSYWHADRTRDFLTYAKANDQLPDVFTWHELCDCSLQYFPGNLATYRAIEDELGIDDIPVNITEYALRRDTGVPGRMIQWISMFEREKVDAQVAYWSQSGNLDDHVAQVNGGNGAWWLLKWYADLTGDTVQLTPPAPNQPGTLQGTAAVDEENKTATVLFGGGTTDAELEFSGLDSDVFGAQVDILVQRTQFSGQEGFAEQPPVIKAERIALDGAGGGVVTVPNGDPMDAYRVIITPASGSAPTPDAAWQTRIEAEATALAGGATITTLAANAQATSGQKDVRGFTNAAASATWSVDVPRDGAYLLGIQYGTSDRPDGTNMKSGRHALFVDGGLGELVQYSSTLSNTYKGRVEVPVTLTAGMHSLSLRASQDGSAALPGSNVALDRFDLTEVNAAETSSYPASLARLSGGAVHSRGEGHFGGGVNLGADGKAAFYLGAANDGYYDLVIEYDTGAAAQLDVQLNDRAIGWLGADAAGGWRTQATVHLAQGIQELTIAGPDVTVRGVTLVRNSSADSRVTTIQAEDPSVVRSAGTTVETPAATYGSNVQGQYVGWISAGRTLTLPRPAAGTEPGQYNLLVRFANATRNTTHPYNTDGISRVANITEVGGENTATGYFRYNYSYFNFWWQNVPIDLTTAEGAIVVGNPSGDAPNIDAFQIAPLVAAVVNERTDADKVKPVAALVAPTTAGPFSQLNVQVDATDDRGLDRVVANIYSNGKLVKSTQTAANGAKAATHTATVTLPDGTYSVKYNAADLAGNIAKTGTFDVTIDATKPKATIKEGTSFTVKTGDTYDLISFKLSDAGKIDKVELNGKVKDLTDNAWSDLNYIEPPTFGAAQGVNTLIVFDVAGNTETYTFTLN
ncbi:hypothetical protein MRBLWS13_002925 [Microbacterium sp. LWS13-1.2]|uniref:CBM6 domain-containing protein n=1 Tax=Microbacterium sp. LWS13-1.2 TaxID=3135264 RepID=A0AAU6SEG4_9MICO